MFSDGGVHPCFLQIACTSEPGVHLKSFNGTEGYEIFEWGGSSIIFVSPRIVYLAL